MATLQDDLILADGDLLEVGFDETVNNTTVNSGGILHVTDGGTANNTTVNANGNLYIFFGGIANNTTIDSDGNLHISGAGFANDTTINANGKLHVSEGGMANVATINANGSLLVSEGGMANVATVNADGRLDVSDGGAADCTTVNSDGILYISNGGSANAATVNPGGRLDVCDGGMIGGEMTFATGATVSFEEGGRLDFDLTRMTPSAEAQVHGLSLVQGAPTFTLTVGGNQWEKCTYVLADGADGFDSPITLISRATGDELGTLTGAWKVRNGNWDYQMSLTGSVLSVSVTEADTVAPTVTGIEVSTTELTNQDVTVTAVFSDDVELAQSLYTIGNGEWQAYENGVTVEQNATVYFMAVDTAGNESEIVSIEVANIDKTPPAKPVATADVTEQTVGEVTVSAEFSEDSVLKEYSLDGETWLPYEEAIRFPDNTSVFFRAADKAGNPSEITEYDVTNIEPALISGAVIQPGESAVVIPGQIYLDTFVSEDGMLFVSTGGTAETVTVEEFGGLHVLSGGTATDLNISENAELGLHIAPDTYAEGTLGESAFEVKDAFVSGWTLDTVRLYVENGGTAEELTVNPGGELHVFSGGTATGILENGGYLELDDEADVSLIPNTLSGITISWNATLHSGTSAVDLTVVKGGHLRIFSGTAADGVTLNPGGELYVSGGGTATGILENGGYLGLEDGANVSLIPNELSGMTISWNATLHSGTSAVNLTLGRGSLEIHSGTAADGTTMNEGSLRVSGGTAANTIMNNGNLMISSGGTAAGTVISGGSLKVFSGGTATETVMSGGRLLISSGGTAVDTTVSSGATLNVSSGGVADGFTIEEGGSIFISSGGTAGHFTISGGSMFRGENGRTYSGVTIEKGGSFSAVPGVVISNLTISSGAVFNLSSGVSADGITVLSGGTLHVSRNAAATNVNWTLADRNALILDSGAYVTYAGPNTGIYTRSGTPVAMTLDNITIQGEDYYVMPEGAINGAIISQGRVTLYGGMVNAAVLKGSSMGIYGGTANAVLTSGGSIIVAGDGILRNLYYTSALGGNNANPTVSISVFGGGIVSTAKLGNIMDSKTLTANMRVFSGGTAVDVTVIGQTRLLIESGGTVFNAALYQNYFNDYGGMVGISVGSGGTLIGATANPGNGITVLSGGTALEVRENGGGVAIDPKMKDPSAVTFVSNSFSGYVYDATVHSGTTANRIILDRTRIDIYSGGTASDTIASAGFIYISSGGYADSTTLKGRFHGAATIANPSMFIYSGGTAEHTYLAGIDYPPNRLSCGIMTLSGGTANHTTIVSGGLLTVSGGVASDVSINGHRCPWLENNYNPNNDDRFYGTMLVQGGTVTDVTVNNGGVLRVSWLNNGSMTGIVENGGYVSASPSNKKVTFASNTFSRIVLGNYESATAHSGTTAASITLESGGRLDLYSDGKLTGRTFMRGGIVSAYEGAVVEFDLTQTAPGAAARIDDLTGIKGTPTYVIAVNADQAQGVYVLAENASAIDVTLTCAEWDKPEDPKDEDDESCKLIVGQSMTIEGVQYTLALTDKTLSLTVGDEAAAAPSPYTTDGLALLSDKISVKKDEVYHDTVLFSGGILRIDDGGMADATTVNSGGSLMISSGGTATDIIENGGFVDVGSGAKATFASNVFRNSMLFGSVTLHSGTTAYNTRIAGDLFIYDGGVASGVACAHPTRNLPYDSYTVTVYSGGVLNDAEVVNSRCIVNVSSGGTANRVSLVYSGLSGYDYDSYSGSPLCGTMTVRQGTANSTTVAQGGTMEIIGGTVTDTYIRGGTVMMEKSKIDVGTANNTVIDGGIMKVGPSCALDGVRVNSGGSLLLNGTASAVNVVENGGFVSAINASSDTNISFLSNTFSGVELTSLTQKAATVHSGTTAVSTTINSRCVLSVYEGGVASGVQINSLGSAIVSGGTANNVVINFRGIMEVAKCKKLDSDGKTLNLLPALNDIIVTSGGSLRISDASEVNGLTVLKGAMFSITGTSGTTFSRTVLTGKDASITLKEGSATDTVLNEGGTIEATDHSTATSTTVNYGGLINVSSGGTAIDTTVNNGGSLSVNGGGTANNTTVNSGGSLSVSSGGTANNTTVNSGGSLSVKYGGSATGIDASCGANLSFAVAQNTLIQGTSDGKEFEIRDGYVSGYSIDHGELTVCNGGSAVDIAVGRDATLRVLNGGTATRVAWTPCVGSISVENGGTISFTSNYSGVYYGDGYSLHLNERTVESLEMDFEEIMYVMFGGTARNITVSAECELHVMSGGMAEDTTVSEGGIHVMSGGTARNTTIGPDGLFEVGFGGRADDTFIQADSTLIVYNGGTVSNTTVTAGGVLTLSTGALITGWLTVEDGAVINASEGITVNFDLTCTEAGMPVFVNDLSAIHIQGASLYTLTVDSYLDPGYYTYLLADGADSFDGTVSIMNAAGRELGTLALGETVTTGNAAYTLNLADSVLSVTVDVSIPTPPANLNGNQDIVSWEPNGGELYTVEYSTDDFEHVIRMVTSADATELLDLPAGTYQWRVKSDINDEWSVGEEIVSVADPDNAPKVIQAVEDGSDDVFFASTNGAWSQFYCAQHVGLVNDWTGTNELVSAEGKGRIQNLFFGSGDPNVLCLTDADNGDAIFVDDAYTGLPEEVEENTARLYRIQDIRAGAGDDIVDMTSQRCEYTGDGLTIRGGDGNDLIWANKGDNMLFGDAGNDRIVGASGNDIIAGGSGDDSMHGGGGSDIFTFCDNWGNDTVEQLEDGFVTLWFASWTEDWNWDDETLTFTSGGNSVTVSGVSVDQVTLMFGSDDPGSFAMLSETGAFEAFSSRRVFEESGQGLLTGQ